MATVISIYIKIRIRFILPKEFFIVQFILWKKSLLLNLTDVNITHTFYSSKPNVNELSSVLEKYFEKFLNGNILDHVNNFRFLFRNH